jgi:hypothetical protein
MKIRLDTPRHSPSDPAEFAKRWEDFRLDAVRYRSADVHIFRRAAWGGGRNRVKQSIGEKPATLLRGGYGQQWSIAHIRGCFQGFRGCFQMGLPDPSYTALFARMP